MSAWERAANASERRSESLFEGRWLFREMDVTDGWTLEGNRRSHREFTAKHLKTGRVLRRRYESDLIEAVRAQDAKLEAAVEQREARS